MRIERARGANIIEIIGAREAGRSAIRAAMRAAQDEARASGARCVRVTMPGGDMRITITGKDDDGEPRAFRADSAARLKAALDAAPEMAGKPVEVGTDKGAEMLAARETEKEERRRGRGTF